MIDRLDKNMIVMIELFLFTTVFSPSTNNNEINRIMMKKRRMQNKNQTSTCNLEFVIISNHNEIKIVLICKNEINCFMELSFLNELKKEDKERRRMQNKRYREKHHTMIKLKKQLSYHKQKYESKLEKSSLAQAQIFQNHA